MTNRDLSGAAQLFAAVRSGLPQNELFWTAMRAEHVALERLGQFAEARALLAAHAAAAMPADLRRHLDA